VQVIFGYFITKFLHIGPLSVDGAFIKFSGRQLVIWFDVYIMEITHQIFINLIKQPAFMLAKQ